MLRLVKPTSWFPIVGQLANYLPDKLYSDSLAALLVTVILIPQSLAYAILAGLPPHYGLYASILPLIVYALFGTSSVLGVGPVAIASIMTASVLSSVVATGQVSHAQGAFTLAFLSGSILLVMGLLRLGFVSHFLSHSVISGFMTASGLIIALAQFRPLLGINTIGNTFVELLVQTMYSLRQVNIPTAILGVSTVLFLLLAKRCAAKTLQKYGLSHSVSTLIARMAPIVAVTACTLMVAGFNLNEQGVAIVGDIPTGIAHLSWPDWQWSVVKTLLMPAFFISMIGYFESISVGKTLGAKKGERINPNQEFIALGGANLASGLVGAFPVTGGFSRSVVNLDAGAKTQMAGVYTAVCIAISSLFLTPYLFYIPLPTLAATIFVAVLSLIDLAIFKKAWRFSKSDFVALCITLFLTLIAGVEAGVASGIVVSILLHVYRTSKPHIAELGLLVGTPHFRNVKYYQVEQIPHVLSLRIDESLIFSNVNYLEKYILDALAQRSSLRHIVLHCGSVNSVDLSGLEMLKRINAHLIKHHIQLHLSELKTPVKMLLDKTSFLSELSGTIYMTHLQAHEALQQS